MPMPRVLFVVDEFQELFVEDDKLAQDAGLLLDRLVRQGRAFGIHVLLGSQTLSGAYSLARSTMGQMAVRVALQCSEADAHLILSDERNEAARFLSRPGEAIYNDQNGLLAGNHPFQVVWLPESQRIELFAAGRSEEQGAGRAAPRRRSFSKAIRRPIRRIICNCARCLQRGPSGAAERAAKGVDRCGRGDQGADVRELWPPCGQQLLVVGAWEESALGVLANAVIALAAQNVHERARRLDPSASHSGRDARLALAVLRSRRHAPESPEAGTWQRIADALPQQIEVGGLRDTARVISEIAAELARREAASEEDAPPIYLVIFNGGRFRDLRRGEDDFSFSIGSRQAAQPRQAMGRDSAQRPGLGRSHARVVRLVQQRQPHARPHGDARVRNAGRVPNERGRFVQLPRQPGRDETAPAPRPVRQRRPGHDRKIPAVRHADG